ncbi:hypothetical protein Gohar_018741, partial [Gossypium harknessii]|nr:hypothetical protein [Gossypium harknessii]
MMSAEEAGCYAFKASIKLACQLNIKGDVLFETDNAGLVNKLRNHSTNVTIISARIKARSCNVTADLISTKKLGFFIWI